MAVDLGILNAQLGSITKNSNIGDILVKAQPAADQVIAQFQTTLTEAETVVDGIKALSQATDIPNQELGDAVDAIVEITGDVPGLADKLIGDVSSASTDLEKITGTAPSNGKLKLTIGSGAPEAVARALKLTASVTANDVTGVLQNLAPARAAGAIGKIDDTINKGISFSTGFGSASLRFTVSFTNLLGFFGGDLFTNLIRKINSESDRVLDGLLSGTKVDKEEVIGLVTNDKKKEAVTLITDNTELEVEVVEKTINSLNLDPAVAVKEDSQIKRSVLPPVRIGDNESTWTGGKSTEGMFTYCDGPEELISEMRNTSRLIKKVIVHWSETYNGQDIGSEEINDWHLDTPGDGGIGYHYVIRRDGRLQRGRPIGRQGYHAKAGNNDAESIGICIVGGYDCLPRTPNPRKHLSSNSFTSQQMKSFKMFIRSFYDVWPSGEAFGHSDVDHNALDPGFSVPQYILANFNRRNSGDLVAVGLAALESKPRQVRLSAEILDNDPEFTARLIAMMVRFPGLTREELYRVIKGESNYILNARNSKTDAAGLFQFIPSTAEGLGHTTGEIRNMTAAQQLEVYERYLVQNSYPGGQLGIMQAAPAYARRGDDYEVYKPGTRAYELNPPWRGPDGKITVGSINAYYAKQPF